MSDINMTPLVDVMLVLVVIFILTAPLLASSIRLDLPRTEGATPGTAPQFVTLVVDASGQAFLDDQPCRRPPWPSACAALAPSGPTPRCSCAPTLPCPMAAWSKSWARPTWRGCSASDLWPNRRPRLPRLPPQPCRADARWRVARQRRALTA